MTIIGIQDILYQVVGDGVHEGGLPTVVSAHQVILLSTKEFHLGVVKEKLGQLRLHDLAVADLLNVVLVLVFEDLYQTLDGKAALLDGGLGGSGTVCVLGWRELPLLVYTEIAVTCFACILSHPTASCASMPP